MAATSCRVVRERPKHRTAALCGSVADILPPYPQNNFFLNHSGGKKTLNTLRYALACLKPPARLTRQFRRSLSARP